MNKSVDSEIRFIADAHEKAMAKGTSDDDFVERMMSLYLSGDISKVALDAAKVLYGYAAVVPVTPTSTLTGLGVAMVAAKVKNKPTPRSSTISSGCGSSTPSFSSCGSSSRSSPC